MQMRKREEIGREMAQLTAAEPQDENGGHKNAVSSHKREKLMLEVLLDIRELLTEQATTKKK